MNFSTDYLRSFLKANVDPNKIIAIITADVKQYVLSRKQNPELFAREVYKWDLVRKWYKRNIKTVEDLREWVSGKLYDPSSSKKCVNNLINQSNFGDWQDGILKGQRGNDDELAAAMQAMKVDNFSEIQALPINNWVIRSGKKRKIDLRIFSTYLMCHDPFNIMQYKDTEFQAACKKWNLSIDMKSNGFTKWQEFAKNILLPLLAEEMNVNIAEPFDFSKLDIENEIDSIREGKFLCMIDVQDFVWMTFHHSESTEPQLTFWKISHGPDDISNEEYAIFESKHLAVVHGLTKAKGKEKESQGDKFIHKIKKGDFFYLCRGNSIRIFGQFDSDEAVINPEKQNDWYQRSYKLIAPSLDTAPYNGSQKWWTPNHNSTCYNIDDNKDFENKILKPYFNLTLADLVSNKKETPDLMITELKNLLLSSKQIILTGAPGTGKTYLAKQVAYLLTGDTKDTPEEESHIGFVQFHPSFDYTDFVEGLRPVPPKDENGTIGFERQDGIFKAFCKRALKNYLDSQKTKPQIEAEDSARIKIDTFLNDAIEQQKTFSTVTQNSFKIDNFDDDNIHVEVPGNEIKKDVVVPYGELLKIFADNLVLNKPGDVKTVFNRVHNRQYDSYLYVIYKEISLSKEKRTAPAAEKITLQNFVFIIDEINRGDISKIFGELFYAIDPGYRGSAGKVKTQYHNLIAKTNDIYKDGFYIPPNVYIIGTMNDIDRSVESMDFAIRRRFTWKEIKAEDRISMWNGQIDSCKDEASKRMKALNDEISRADSLGDAFHIGPAYFLKLKEYEGNFDKLWTLHIQPLLQEYLRGTATPEEEMGRFKSAYDLNSTAKTKEVPESDSTTSEE